MTIQEYDDLVEATGGFVCLTLAASLVGVCRQRMYQLVEEGRLPYVKLLGQRMVKLPELRAWAAGSRQSGRPRGVAPVGADIPKRTSAGRVPSLRRRVEPARAIQRGIVKSSLFERIKEARRKGLVWEQVE